MLKINRTWWVLISLIPLVFISIFFVWPVLTLISTGITGNLQQGLEAFHETLMKPRTWVVTGQTLLQAFTASLLSVLLGLPAAFILYRLKFPGRKVLRALLTIPFVLPTVVVAAAFMALYGPGGILSFLGLDRTFIVLIMALTFFNITVVMRIVGGFWENLDPRQSETARMLGASATRAFFTVTLPALLRPIGSAAALVFLFCATSFGVVFVLGGKRFANIETEIYRVTMQLLDLQTAAILALLQIIIVLATLLVSARTKGASPFNNPTDRVVSFNLYDHFMVLTVFVISVISIHALPIISLLIRSLKNVSGEWSLANYLLLLQPPPSSPLTNSIGNAIWLSTIFAFLAMVLALLFGLITAVVTTRKTQNRFYLKIQQVYEYSLMMPLGVSAVVLGLGLLLTMHRPLGIGFDLRSSLILLPIAQTLIALPLVIRTLLPAVQRISTTVKETALMLGASPTRIIFTVELPLIKNALAVAAGFAFATSLGEFGAAAFLVRSSEKTLPVVIAQLLTSQDPTNHGMGIAASVILGIITAVVMVAAENIGLKNKIGWAL